MQTAELGPFLPYVVTAENTSTFNLHNGKQVMQRMTSYLCRTQCDDACSPQPEQELSEQLQHPRTRLSAAFSPHNACSAQSPSPSGPVVFSAAVSNNIPGLNATTQASAR